MSALLMSGPCGMAAHVLTSQAINQEEQNMNATFSSPITAVKWANKYERMGYVVAIEARGSKLFVTAYKAQPARRTA